MPLSTSSTFSLSAPPSAFTFTSLPLLTAAPNSARATLPPRRPPYSTEDRRMKTLMMIHFSA